MEKILVCKLHRLAKDGDHFKKNIVAAVLRTNAKIGESYYNRFNANWKTSGQIYELDEAKTKERDEIYNPVKKTRKPKLKDEINN